jgi:hypothetical protein
MIKEVEWCNANGNGYRRDIVVYIYTHTIECPYPLLLIES